MPSVIGLVLELICEIYKINTEQYRHDVMKIKRFLRIFADIFLFLRANIFKNIQKINKFAATDDTQSIFIISHDLSAMGLVFHIAALIPLKQRGRAQLRRLSEMMTLSE